MKRRSNEAKTGGSGSSEKKKHEIENKLFGYEEGGGGANALETEVMIERVEVVSREERVDCSA